MLDEVCTCWYLAITDDTAPLGWFAGFQPKPGTQPTTPKPQPKPTGPRRPSTIRVSLDRNYCQLSVAMWSLTPGFTDPPTTKWGALVVTSPARRAARCASRSATTSRAARRRSRSSSACRAARTR